MKRPASIPAGYADKIERLDEAPIVIGASRARAILLFVGCLTFVLLGLAAVFRGEEDVMAVALPSALVFGLGMLIAGLQIARPPTLTITREGVTVKTMFRTWSVDFVHVESFFVHRRPTAGVAAGFGTSDMAAFHWIDTDRKPRRFSFGLTPGIDGGFGPGWSLSPRHLADLLNAARRKATGEEPLS